MALIKCSECGKEFSDKARCCPNCGAPVVIHKWRCSKCGNMISEEPCPYCSDEQTAVNTNTVSYENSVEATPAFVTKKKRSLGILISVLIIAACAIIIAIPFLQNSSSTKLNGEYIAQTEFSYNLITFADNGGFVRSSRTFGDWQLVADGKYSLEDSSLILYCSDGRVWEFYYDRKNDTMTQVSTNDVYTRYNGIF